MANEIFPVNGNKIATLFLDTYSFKFSSSQINSIEDFEKAWDKKLTLAKKIEIQYDSVKAVRKEESDKEIIISYKTSVGITSQCQFSFPNANDYETFFAYLENEIGLDKEEETLAPFKAILNYLFGLIITVAITVFGYFEAIKIANGTASEGTNGKARLFNSIVGILGDKGVLFIGGGVTCYILFQMWKRYTNPPNQVRFTPKDI